MFRSAFQKGFLTVLYAGGANPLKIWDRYVMNGHVKRITDEDVRTLVLEMCGTNVATCYIYTPVNPKETLGIKLPFLVMIIKNLKKYFSFEIVIMDDRHMRRRFRVSNYQSTTKVRPFGTTMPIGLNPGWNQIQFNLADFTKRAYGSTYVETLKMQIHANCRIRRIYFCDRLYREDELPNEYKLFCPVIEDKSKKTKKKDTKVESEVPPPSEAGDEIEHPQVIEEEEREEVEERMVRGSMEVQPSEAPESVFFEKEPSAVMMAHAEAEGEPESEEEGVEAGDEGHEELEEIPAGEPALAEELPEEEPIEEAAEEQLGE